MSDRSSPWGLNPSTISLLVVILLIAAGYELFKPYMPRYISKDDPSPERLGGVILWVGLYGSLIDLLEGVYYRAGGRIGARLGARRSFLLFTLMPIAGAAIVLLWPSMYAPLVAVPFLTAWDSISMPATLTVVGETVPKERRTLAFSLQSIQRRIPRVVGYVVGGLLMARKGDELGMHIALVAFMTCAAIALVVQLRFLKVEAKDANQARVPAFRTIRAFPRDLKLLLASDVLVRWCEGLPRELVVLYLTAAVPLGMRIDAEAFGWYIALSAAVSLVVYIPIGLAASKAGTAKKPYIGLTFLFFALFPLAVTLCAPYGTIGLVLAFVVMGLREIGEPARKAMITELVPQDRRTEVTGLYWSARSFLVMLAPIAGALAWKYGDPALPFYAATAIGLAGAVFFYATFGRPATAACGATTATGPATPP